eukprot:2920676-Rhodomonas_salina.3
MRRQLRPNSSPSLAPSSMSPWSLEGSQAAQICFCRPNLLERTRNVSQADSGIEAESVWRRREVRVVEGEGWRFERKTSREPKERESRHKGQTQRAEAKGRGMGRGGD